MNELLGDEKAESAPPPVCCVQCEFDGLRRSILIVCRRCGYKRCPKARWHSYK